MKGFNQVIFWITILIILTVTFGRTNKDFIQSFYFVSFLFPVIVGTAYFFNNFLVTNYLLKKQYFEFTLYFIYTFIVSIYLEMLVLTLSLIILADYNYKNLNPKTTDIILLSIILYFFVLLNTIIFLLKEFYNGQQKLQNIELERKLNEKGYLTVRCDRKITNILFEDIKYIESLGDYIKIHCFHDKIFKTKEKISNIQQRLSKCFLRIHRSYIINRKTIISYNKESITIDKINLPLSRKYKEDILNQLKERNKL